MKTLEVGKALDPEYTNVFVCEIETMLGDADDDDTVELVLPHPVEDVIDDLEKLLKKLQSTDDAEYHKVKNFGRFFTRWGEKFSRSKDEPADFAADWVYESDYGYYYAYRSHQYYWYDYQGKKHEANLITAKKKAD